MRITLFLTIVLSCNVFGTVSSQNVKLNFENATLRQVFKDLKQQTGFLFIYNEEELDRRAKVSLKEENITLKTALEKYCLVYRTLLICWMIWW